MAIQKRDLIEMLKRFPDNTPIVVGVNGHRCEIESVDHLGKLPLTIQCDGELPSPGELESLENKLKEKDAELSKAEADANTAESKNGVLQSQLDAIKAIAEGVSPEKLNQITAVVSIPDDAKEAA